MNIWTNECAVARGWYFLDLLRDEGQLPVFQIGASSDGGRFHLYNLPALKQTRYLLRVEKTVHLAVMPDNGALIRVQPLNLTNIHSLSWLRKSDRKACLKIRGEFSLRPLLAANGSEGKELKKGLSILRKFGFPVSSDNFQRKPLLFDGNLSLKESFPKFVQGTKPVFVVALHLHYLELWNEVEFFLARISVPFHLVITTSQVAQGFDQKVKRSFPEAEIVIVENKGRDIGAFIEALNQGCFDGFDYICKIHGKVSGRSGPRALLGHVWRRANFVDLIGSDEQVQRILGIFGSAQQVGMVGSEIFHFPTEHFHGDALWGENRKQILELTAKLNIGASEVELEYFAGSMFWISRPVVDQIRKLGIRMEDFPNEGGSLDGELNHALERVFGLCVSSAGMRLADVCNPFWNQDGHFTNKIEIGELNVI